MRCGGFGGGPDLLVAELAADGPDLGAEGGGEHHDLLGVGRLEEDLLDLGAHVCGSVGGQVDVGGCRR